MKQFVFLNRDVICGTDKFRKNEIGILESESQGKAIVTLVTKRTAMEISSSDITYFDPCTTGDQFSKKVCNVCNRLLDVNLFEKNQNGINNRSVRRPSCNECREVIDSKGMTAKEKRQMEQIKPDMEIWTCPICGKTTIPGLTSKVVCDHDHKTGHPRAWICDSCNTGLGRFKDDVALLEKAIEYLKSN